MCDSYVGCCLTWSLIANGDYVGTYQHIEYERRQLELRKCYAGKIYDRRV